MSSPEEFLSRLDHVVDDYETSDDAMRWSPEPVEPQPHWLGRVMTEWVRPITLAAADIARLRSLRGHTLGPMVLDEIAGWSFPGALDRADRISPKDEGPQQDPDKPGYPITLRQGVAAQHSPYGPKPRSRDGQEMRGDDARRARLCQTGRPRGSRSHLGDRDRT